MSVEAFAIHFVTLPGGGKIGLCRMPGRGGDIAADVAAITAWSPAVVVSLAGRRELEVFAADRLPEMLAPFGVGHAHFPIADYSAPDAGDAGWRAVADRLLAALDGGGRVLVHCMGGCGRSGAAALRLMVERGEAAEAALARLRAVRPCAVETDGQLAWAAAGAHHQPAVRPK
jgi:hypothetical protein